jgi:uncharacterized protein DUF3291
MYHLAQLNVARPVAPVHGPELADFVANLPAVNALAEQSPGFVWRLVDEQGHDATSLRPFGDDTMVNLSVWESVEALSGYVYRSRHLDILRRRREWFQPATEPHLVLWWVPAGHRPDLTEAIDRLHLLREHGPGPDAFTLRVPYSAPTEAVGTLGG